MTTRPEEQAPRDLSGITVVVTGASDGIGRAAARELHARGATVVPVGRTPAKVEAIAAELGAKPHIADYARLESVRDLAAELLAELPRIDVLAHNAGGISRRRETTVDGHERTMQVNYLAPFLLHRLLEPRLAETGAHTVVTSSVAHWAGRLRLDDLDFERKPWRVFSAYGDSKLAGLLWARALAARTPLTGVTAEAFHPGVIRSEFGVGEGGLFRMGYGTWAKYLFTRPPGHGAAPLVALATHPPEQRLAHNGDYWHRLRPRALLSRAGRDAGLAEDLWEATTRLLGL